MKVGDRVRRTAEYIVKLRAFGDVPMETAKAHGTVTKLEPLQVQWDNGDGGSYLMKPDLVEVVG